MINLPDVVIDYARRVLIEARSPAYLVVDDDGSFRSAGGALDVFGFTDIQVGESAVDRVWFLEGLLPVTGDSFSLAAVQMPSGRFADVHVLPMPGCHWVVLLDASDEVAQRMAIEDALRTSEEQLRQSQKMEAVGRLAGGVAHDFNNLLAVILGYLEVMFEDLDEQNPMRPAAEEVQKAADRAVVLTRRLLTFSRRQNLNPHVLNPNAVITDIEQMLRRILGADVQLTTDLEPALWHIRADRGQFEQAIVNLAANARDAMPGGGVLTVSTRNVDAGESTGGPLPADHGQHVRVSVRDTGVGMDAFTRSRVFEPFFTTKEPGKGTGLGLATVYGIVQQSLGYVWIDSEPGAGTQVNMLWPRVVQPAETVVPRTAIIDRPRAHETILVVDDDDSVRLLVVRMLTHGGYCTLEASGPEAAAAVCRTHAGTIDLLLTDMVMPGQGGTQLAEHIRSIRPDLAVAFMSGCPNETLVRRGVAPPEQPILAKPFSKEELCDHVRAALETHRSLIAPGGPPTA